jgi:hypothetical protein
MDEPTSCRFRHGEGLQPNTIRRLRERGTRHLTPAQYKSQRTMRNLTMQEIADALKIHWTTVSRRERGIAPIKPEDAIAIHNLPMTRNVARCWECWENKPVIQFDYTHVKRFKSGHKLRYGYCVECLRTIGLGSVVKGQVRRVVRAFARMRMKRFERKA